MAMLARIEKMIGSLSMYKFVLYTLGIVAGAAILLAFAGIVPRPGIALLASLCITIFVSYGASLFFAAINKTTANPESAVITGLIMFAIISPPTDIASAVGIAVACVIAMGSKYLIAYRQAHIFNPAAFGAYAISLLGLGYASWGITTSTLLPLVAVAAILVLWRLREFRLFGIYLASSVAMLVLISLIKGTFSFGIFQESLVSWPLIFLGAFMLTEPLTMPGDKINRWYFAAFTGLLGASQLDIGIISASPIVGLLAANLLFFIIVRRQTTTLTLLGKKEIAPSTYELTFKPTRPVSFTAGQYAELTLPHDRPDARSIRRSFSFTSDPHDDTVTFGIKWYDRPSSFKRALSHLKPGQSLRLTRVAGDFTVSHQNEKLLFIAGGIGITPFISMLRALQRDGGQRDIILLYCVTTQADLAYQDVLVASKASGVRVIPIIAEPNKQWRGPSGYLSEKILDTYASDIRERHIYISGPPIIVSSASTLVLKKGALKIETDYFSGY